MRLVRTALALLLLVALPGWAGAYEAQFGLRASVGYESNIALRTFIEVPDAVYRISPTLRLRHQTGRLDARLDYRPVGEIFHQNPGANGADQLLAFVSTYDITQRSSLTLRDDFGYVRNIQQLNSIQAPGQPDLLQIGLRRTTVNRASASLRHVLTPRTSFAFAAQHLYRDSANDNDSALETLIGSANANYLLTRQDTVGLGASYTYTSLGDANSRDLDLEARRTNSLNIFAVWAREWNRKWRTSLQIGPAWVRSTRRLTINQTPPIGGPPMTVLDQRIVNDSVTAFGRASITRFWRTGEVTLNYQRSLSAVNTVGTDSTIDALFGFLRWEPNEEWDFTLRAGWNQRVSIAAQSIGNVLGVDTGITQYSANLNLKRRLTRRMSVGLLFRFLRQEPRDIRSGIRGFTNYQVSLGARYDFAPLRP